MDHLESILETLLIASSVLVKDEEERVAGKRKHRSVRSGYLALHIDGMASTFARSPLLAIRTQYTSVYFPRRKRTIHHRNAGEGRQRGGSVRMCCSRIWCMCITETHLIRWRW